MRVGNEAKLKKTNPVEIMKKIRCQVIKSYGNDTMNSFVSKSDLNEGRDIYGKQ